MKKSFGGKLNGIDLEFPNGNSLSGIWNAGSYTENHNKERVAGEFLDSNTIEVLVDCPEPCKEVLNAKLGKEFGSSDVFGHLSMAEFLTLVSILGKEGWGTK